MISEQQTLSLHCLAFIHYETFDVMSTIWRSVKSQLSANTGSSKFTCKKFSIWLWRQNFMDRLYFTLTEFMQVFWNYSSLFTQTSQYGQKCISELIFQQSSVKTDLWGRFGQWIMSDPMEILSSPPMLWTITVMCFWL